MDDIIGRLAKLTINNLGVQPHVGATIEEVAEALNQLSMNDDDPSSSPFHSTSPQSPPNTARPPDDDLDRLVFLDNQLDSHMQQILRCLDSLADPDPSSQQKIHLDLVEEQKLLKTSLRQLGGLEAHHDNIIRELAVAMRKRIAVFSSAIDFYLEVLGARSPLEVRASVKSGTLSLLLILDWFNIAVIQPIFLRPICNTSISPPSSPYSM